MGSNKSTSAWISRTSVSVSRDIEPGSQESKGGSSRMLTGEEDCLLVHNVHVDQELRLGFQQGVRKADESQSLKVADVAKSSSYHLVREMVSRYLGSHGR